MFTKFTASPETHIAARGSRINALEKVELAYVIWIGDEVIYMQISRSRGCHKWLRPSRPSSSSSSSSSSSELTANRKFNSKLRLVHSKHRPLFLNCKPDSVSCAVSCARRIKFADSISARTSRSQTFSEFVQPRGVLNQTIFIVSLCSARKWPAVLRRDLFPVRQAAQCAVKLLSPWRRVFPFTVFSTYVGYYSRPILFLRWYLRDDVIYHLKSVMHVPIFLLPNFFFTPKLIKKRRNDEKKASIPSLSRE